MSEPGLFEKITTFMCDVDGVLTDGTVLVLENGLQARRMNIRDGYALQLAVKKGYRVVVVSGAGQSPVIDRLAKLGITEVFFGIADKLKFVREYMSSHGLAEAEVLFMGDDVPDRAAMQAVGLPVCPADAVEEIKGISKYISKLPGGLGCVREVIEMTMKLRGHWHHETNVASR